MTEEVRLNFGCGENHREGYINCDIRFSVDPDKLCDLRYPPFPDDYADEIVAQDLLEHFKKPVGVLKQWRRVLKEGGVLYLRVPDFEKIIDPEFISSTPFKNTENRVLGGRDNPYDVHKSLFTEDVLRERLEEAGFGNIVIKKSREPPLHWFLLCKAEKV